MKEMLGNLADGQIEFYKAVRTSNSGPIESATLYLRLLVGYGGVGTHHTYNSANTGGRLTD